MNHTGKDYLMLMVANSMLEEPVVFSPRSLSTSVQSLDWHTQWANPAFTAKAISMKKFLRIFEETEGHRCTSCWGFK